MAVCQKSVESRKTSTGRVTIQKLPQFSEFERYAKDRAREIKRSLSAIERRGAEGAVDRCRALADQISRNLRNNRLGLFGNNPSLLAELQVSNERAASVLEIAALNHDQKGTLRKMKGLGGRAQRQSNRRLRKSSWELGRASRASKKAPT
jgi:hypothetical protein